MATIYELLRASKGHAYKDTQLKDYSFLKIKPEIDKPAGALAGLSRIHGDATFEVQDRVMDILIEIGTRYKLPYRDIAHLLLFCKIESGFNPDAAAGTSSAAGLGQYTKDTVIEVAKPQVSKKRLGFSLDLSGDYVFDAERGAYSVVLSYMMSKEKAIQYFETNYEKYTYLFHHEGWYFRPTEAHMAQTRSQEVLDIINKKILPHLDKLEKLLSEKTDVTFKLITADDEPYANQPYLAVFPAKKTAGHNPFTVQGALQKSTDFIFGKTDGQGKTKPVSTLGLSEIVFVILNKNYKDYLHINSNQDTDIYTVKKGESLSKIAKSHGTSVGELQKINHIANPNQLKVGQHLRLHEADYLWRRPPMLLVSEYLQSALNMNGAATPAIVEHKRMPYCFAKRQCCAKT